MASSAASISIVFLKMSRPSPSPFDQRLELCRTPRPWRPAAIRTGAIWSLSMSIRDSAT
jgi:hypothetical protein